jgi:hypothetical protein
MSKSNAMRGARRSEARREQANREVLAESKQKADILGKF